MSRDTFAAQGDPRKTLWRLAYCSTRLLPDHVVTVREIFFTTLSDDIPLDPKVLVFEFHQELRLPWPPEDCVDAFQLDNLSRQMQSDALVHLPYL